MADTALALEPRAERGSAASRRSRGAGRIPAVLYGHGDAPIAVTVDARELRAALGAAAHSGPLFEVVCDGVRHLAIAREIQRHPVRQTLAHIDFQVVRRDEVITTDVPVELVGDAREVHLEGGNVEHALLSIRLHGTPAQLPAQVDLDVSEMRIGMTLRVGDLRLPAGVTTDADPETAVAVAVGQRGTGIGEAAEGAEAAADEASVAPAGAEVSEES